LGEKGGKRTILLSSQGMFEKVGESGGESAQERRNSAVDQKRTPMPLLSPRKSFLGTVLPFCRKNNRKEFEIIRTKKV